MQAPAGLILRLVGFLIEILCVIPLISIRGQGRTFAGLAAESWLYGGLAVGFVVWGCGMVATRMAARTKPSSRPDDAYE